MTSYYFSVPAEAVSRGGSLKKVFLKILQNPQEKLAPEYLFYKVAGLRSAAAASGLVYNTLE